MEKCQPFKTTDLFYVLYDKFTYPLNTRQKELIFKYLYEVLT